MKSDYPYGLSLVLCGVGILLYSCLVFMGLNFHYGGDLVAPIMLTLFGIIIVVSCLMVMCKSKRSRQWRKGIFKEISATVAVLGVLSFGSIPLNHFINIWGQEDELNAVVKESVDVMSHIHEDYIQYVDHRIAVYDSLIMQSRDPEYSKMVKGAAGRYKKNKSDRLCKSLRTRLMPVNLESVFSKRCAWLKEFNHVSVWNIFTPQNIQSISEVSQQWVHELTEVSSKQYYYGEPVTPFSMPLLNNRIEVYKRSYSEYSSPGILGFVAVLLGFLFVLTPYFVARRPKTGSFGTHV